MARVLRTPRRLLWTRRAGRVLAGLVACLLLAGVVVPPAAAHSSLRSSRPAHGTVLAVQPARVELQFDHAVEQLYALVRVVGPDGADRQQGEPLVRGTLVTQAVGALDLPGRYRVSYRLTSSGDQHPVVGALSFDVVAGAAARPAGLLQAGPAAASPDVPPVSGARLGALGSVAALLLVAVLRRRRPLAS